MSEREELQVSLSWEGLDILRKALEVLNRHEGISKGEFVDYDNMYSVSWSLNGVTVETIQEKR